MYKTTNTFISYSILDTEKQGLTRLINKITIWIQMVNKIIKSVDPMSLKYFCTLCS